MKSKNAWVPFSLTGISLMVVLNLSAQTLVPSQPVPSQPPIQPVPPSPALPSPPQPGPPQLVPSQPVPSQPTPNNPVPGMRPVQPRGFTNQLSAFGGRGA